MPLVTSTEMFKKAYEGGYAIGAFNVNNMEIIQGITEAAKEVNAPLILQVSAGARKYAKPVYLTKLVEAAILDTGLPICLHLDHGEDFEICKSCIDGGFTSVMIDGSKYPFKENIRITKEVVDYAHSKGVVVEGELGRLAGVEDNISVSAEDALYTDPDEVKNSLKKPESILWQSPSEQATVHTNLRVKLVCVLTFSKKSARDCRDSRLFYTVLLPLCRI